MDARLYLLVMVSSRCVKVEAISVMAEAKRESDESFACSCCQAEGQRSDNTRSAEERDGVKDVQVRERNDVDRHFLPCWPAGRPKVDSTRLDRARLIRFDFAHRRMGWPRKGQICALAQSNCDTRTGWPREAGVELLSSILGGGTLVCSM
jgi:hypothetical protein